jgi:hypothetical protein
MSVAAMHEVQEGVEEMLVVQRSRGGLGMKLNRQGRQVSVCESLDGPVIEIDETYLPPAFGRHAHRIDLEPVVL